MKKTLMTLLLAAGACLVLTGCCLKHEWQEATSGYRSGTTDWCTRQSRFGNTGRE